MGNYATKKINEHNGTDYSREELGNGLEKLKQFETFTSNEHGIITADGSFFTSTGRFIGNIFIHIIIYLENLVTGFHF
jgi:hypothetical protein